MVVAKRSAETFTEFDDAGRIADFATGTTINRTCYVAPVGPRPTRDTASWFGESTRQTLFTNLTKVTPTCVS